MDFQARVLALTVIAALALRAAALCPYHMLWLPGSPMKLADDHPALRGVATAQHPSRELMQATAAGEEPRGTGTAADPGAGSCSYVNPITQQPSCVQFTGEAWVGSPDAAEERCTVQGVLPGAAEGAVYAAAELCGEFLDAGFAGVCIRDGGSPEELRTPFAIGDGNTLSSCARVKDICETFSRGLFDADGGRCSEGDVADVDGDGAAVEAGVGADGTADAPMNSSAICQLSPGISGGGHMHVDSYWGPECENQDNEYAMPMRWSAVVETILVQKGGRAIGPVYYDLANNRKRADWVATEGNDGFVFFNLRNATFIHDHGDFYFIDWDTGVCTTSRAPVGNQRPAWVLDNLGAGVVSQYLGYSYLEYEGEYRRVRQWRKTEPLENAYMIQSFDEDSVWETPEGPKRRALRRETPGSPGQGDSIDIFYNHTTDFDDSVFDILDGFECGPAPPTAFGGLNTNTTLEIDSGFIRVECEDCNLTYSDRQPESETEVKEEGLASDVNGAADAAVYVNGTEVIREEGRLELSWEYSPETETFSFSLKSEAATGWLSVGFPKFACAMVPADAVIGKISEDGSEWDVAPYKLSLASLTGVLVDEDQVLESADLSVADDMRTLSFSRKADNGGQIVLDPTSPIDLLWAAGTDEPLTYHGSDGRGCVTVNSKSS